MVVMNSPKKSLSSVLEQLKVLNPSVKFQAAKQFSWSPKDQLVSYVDIRQDDEAVWSLLHEVAHANLKHTTYETDFELLKMEVDAWQHSKTLAKDFGVAIDDDYVQNCLDSYRDWLHRRSTCPTCGTVGLQHASTMYRCHNCNSSWNVTASRFCRPYRRKATQSSDTSPATPGQQPTFH